MFSIDKQSRTPIYEQLIANIEQSILHGIILENSKIPSVRELSTTLGINPNTIQKAYTSLENRDITCSVPGVGRFVSSNAMEILKSGGDKYFSELFSAVENLKLLGISKEEIKRAIDNM